MEVEAALNGKGELNGGSDNSGIAQRLEAIYKRLDFIDADSAESRAASILAVSLQTLCAVCNLQPL